MTDKNSERAAPSARAPLPVPPDGLQLGKVPYRARFRSDKHAAVLRLQSTQPKDRRVYTALTGILTDPQAAGKNRKGSPADSAAHSELLSAHEPFQASPNIRNRSGVLVICWKLTMLCIV